MKNKHTYTNIQEKRITLPDNVVEYICYAVSVITEYTNIFGKHKTKIENLPFLFPSLEIAKEYCEIMPTYKNVTLSNDNISKSYYSTYQLFNDKKESIGYIMWNINFIKKDIETYSTGYGTRAIHTKYIIDTPLIDYFAYDIWVPSTANIEGCNNIQVGWVKTCCKKLSDLIRETMPIIDNTKNSWKFEMIETK